MINGQLIAKKRRKKGEGSRDVAAFFDADW